MILGVGIDLCDISRMRESLARPRFLTRFFSDGEQAYIASRGAAGEQSAAGIYAAKEAFAKALGTGISGFDLRDVQVSHDACGAPKYLLTGGALAAAAACGITRMHLSITHDGGMAAAVAVAEGEP